MSYPYRVRERQRVQTGAGRGMRSGWVEYQVVQRNKIISRHETKAAAFAEEHQLNIEVLLAATPKFLRRKRDAGSL